MDIVKTFSAYINAPENSIRREISNSPEVWISKKYNDLNDNLGKLRCQTVKFSYIDSKGTMKVRDDDPAYADLQKQIQTEETRFRRLREIADEIGSILEGQKVAGIYELQEIRDMHVNTVMSAPLTAWHVFVLARGEGHFDSGNRMSWLPSDLAQEPGYKAEEDRLRAGIEAAKAAIVPIKATLQKLEALAAEANSL